MARIRTIKPEFFKHEELFELEVEINMPVRIAFAGLWCCCDREGRFKWRPRQLKTDILPYDSIDFEKLLDAMEVKGLVRKYSIDGKMYGHVPSFLKHQSINQREANSSIPEPTADSYVTHMHAHESNIQDNAYVYRGVNIAPALRETILERDGKVCLRCGAVDDLTVDHIFPRSIGGTHAPANLRTLCRTCNSARPVQGKELINDLAKDGFSIDDMQRICMHVGKGRERKGKEEEGKEITSAAFSLPDWIDADDWNLWIKTRKGKKMLPEQMQAQVEKLRKWKDAGLPYWEALRDSASNGWQGLFEPKVKLKNSQDSKLDVVNQIMGGINGANRPIRDITPQCSNQGDRARIPEVIDGVWKSDGG